jgi:hypothetical protein
VSQVFPQVFVVLWAVGIEELAIEADGRHCYWSGTEGLGKRELSSRGWSLWAV